MDAPKEHRWVSEIEPYPDGHQVVFCCECGVHRVEASAGPCPGDVVKTEMLEALKDAVTFLKNVSDDLLGHHPGECCCHRCNLIRLIAEAEGRNG